MPSQPLVDAQVLVVEFPAARVLHVAPSKVGSTSIIQAYGQMAGLDIRDGSVRNDLRREMVNGRGAAAGLAMGYVAAAQLPDLVAARPGWRVLANVRSPYDRAVSNWHSKLNRYARRYDPWVYYRGKLGQLFEGPKAWPHIERANAHMQPHIPFRSMVAGLALNGVSFDRHFEQQALLLALDRVRYDHVFRLERFGTDFPAVLAGLGIGAEFTGRLSIVPHSNRTAAGRPGAGLLDAATVALIDRAYPQDKALLGYGDPLAGRVARSG